MMFDPTYPLNLAFLPPQIEIHNNKLITDLLFKARLELAELKGFTSSIPNPMLLTSPAVIKESIASSQIENINTTIVDVLQNQVYPEIEQKQADKEVFRYRDAILWGDKHLHNNTFSTRLITGIEKILIPRTNGEYRKQQNKIENSLTKETIFTPPIASNIPNLLSNWENFVNKDANDFDPLIKCIISHYQFEAIHPFIDGNGRTGRILMVLQLKHYDLLNWPILFISSYINKNRKEYYSSLLEVTKTGNWENYIAFMLNGFYLQAKETLLLESKIKDLFFEFKKDLKENHKNIYSADLVEALFSHPIVTPVFLALKLGVHYTTTSRYLNQLAKAKILREKKIKKYHFYTYDKLLRIMQKDSLS